VELKLFISEPLPCSKRATILDSYEHHRSFAVIFIPSGSTCKVDWVCAGDYAQYSSYDRPVLEFLNLNPTVSPVWWLRASVANAFS